MPKVILIDDIVHSCMLSGQAALPNGDQSLTLLII